MVNRRIIRNLYAISQIRRQHKGRHRYTLWNTIQYVLGPTDTRWRARRRVRPA